MPGLSWEPTENVVWHQWLGQPGPCSAALRDLKHEEPSKTVDLQLAGQILQPNFSTTNWNTLHEIHEIQRILCNMTKIWYRTTVERLGDGKYLGPKAIQGPYVNLDWSNVMISKLGSAHLLQKIVGLRSAIVIGPTIKGLTNQHGEREIGAVIGNQPCSYAFSTHYMLCMPL